MNRWPWAFLWGVAAVVEVLGCGPRPQYQPAPIASPAHGGPEPDPPALRRPCGADPVAEEPKSCLPREMRGALMMTDDRLKVRAYEACSAPMRDGRVASSAVFYVERYGTGPLPADTFNKLQMVPDAWTKLVHSHGLSRVDRSRCSDSTGTVSVPCVKVGFYSTGLNVAAVASILAEGYSQIGDACLIVEVMNGIRRQRMQ